MFRARDMLRDGPTFFRFSAVMGLQMGQVLPAAFVGLMLPVIYREQGLSLDMWWVFTIPMIPTWLRPLWAPFVDRTGSRSFGMRRSWFIPCTTMGAFAYMGMTLFEPTIENLVVVIALWTLKNSIMTTQDVAIDGYMVENIHDEERPVAAGVLDIARNIGMFVSWVGIAWLYDAYGWTIAMLVASLLLIACSLPGILRPEPPRPLQYERAAPPSLKSLFARRESYYVYPLCFFVAMAGAIIATMYPTYLSDLGFRAAEVATMVGPATLVGTIIGASIASWVLSTYGYLKAFLIAAVMMVLAVIPIIWMGSLEEPSYAVVFGVTLNGIALPSFLTVAFQAARLKWASKSQAATDYTTQIVTMAAGGALATSIGGFIAHHLGWFWHFVIGGSATVTMCFTLYFLYERIEAIVEERDRRELESADSAAAANGGLEGC